LRYINSQTPRSMPSLFERVEYPEMGKD